MSEWGTCVKYPAAAPTIAFLKVLERTIEPSPEPLLNLEPTNFSQAFKPLTLDCQSWNNLHLDDCYFVDFLRTIHQNQRWGDFQLHSCREDSLNLQGLKNDNHQSDFHLYYENLQIHLQIVLQMILEKNRRRHDEQQSAQSGYMSRTEKQKAFFDLDLSSPFQLKQREED